MNISALFRRGRRLLHVTNSAAVLRPSAAATSVADEGSTSTTTLSIVDSAGRMLVDQNGNLIISFAGNK
jgi:hypothetical protein